MATVTGIRAIASEAVSACGWPKHGGETIESWPDRHPLIYSKTATLAYPTVRVSGCMLSWSRQEYAENLLALYSAWNRQVSWCDLSSQINTTILLQQGPLDPVLLSQQDSASGHVMSLPTAHALSLLKRRGSHAQRHYQPPPSANAFGWISALSVRLYLYACQLCSPEPFCSSPPGLLIHGTCRHYPKRMVWFARETLLTRHSDNACASHYWYSATIYWSSPCRQSA